MCGMGHLAWVICLLTVSQVVTHSNAQGFVYSKHSCLDLEPRHREAIRRAEEQDINHVQQPGDNTTEPTSTVFTTPRPPPPKVGRYTGSVTVEVLTSEDSYRRLKTLVVTLRSADYFNGFLLQARKVPANSNAAGEVVGRFMEIPHRGSFLTCPNGTQPENTVVNEDAPLRMSNLSFTWMAPEIDLGTIEFVASVLLSSATEYKVFKSPQLDLNLYPVSTKECAAAKSCFRYCMMDHGQPCEAHMSRYMATLEFIAQKTKVKITIGGQLPSSDGYLALGFSQDGHTLNDADITVCYRNDDNTVGVEHYLLDDLNHSPDLHLGVLRLEASDVDEDYIWCTFTRPLTGQDDNRLNLQNPHYYYYFWGMRNGTNIFLPSARQMKRSDKMISLQDKLFNQISYSGGPGSRPPFTIVAAVILLLSIHFLCW